MVTRKSATKMKKKDWGNFAKALILLKADILNPEDPEDEQISVYDLFNAIHIGIRRVRTPDRSTTNMGHNSAGFCPWHREFLLRLEKEMQKKVPSSFIPYWDWTDHQGIAKLFTKKRLGERSGPIVNGYFAFDAPGTGANTLKRPDWWVASLKGWRIPKQLQYGRGQGLSRSADSRDLATLDHINIVKDTDNYEGGASIDWLEPGTNRQYLLDGGFRKRIEGGGGGGVPRTHNFGHGWIGGQMGHPFTSPLDPIFFMHHCNIDRIWSEWQDEGHSGTEFYPEAGFDMGHNLKDSMWPWVGGARNYQSLTRPAGIPWPDFTSESAVSPESVIDIASLGYK